MKRKDPPPADTGKKDYRINFSLARGLSVLRAFGPGNRPIGNSEISARLNLPKATISRLTFTLTELGYLNHDEETGWYSLGPEVLTLGYDIMSQMEIRDIARPYMQELANYADASVYLGTLSGSELIYIEACRTPSSMAIRLGVGSRIPLFSTGMGRAFMATIPAKEREALIAKISSDYGGDWPKVEADLNRAIDYKNTHGFSLSGGDWIAEANSAGAVICRADGYPVYGINIGGLKSIVSTERLEKDLGPRLVKCARQIEQFARNIL